MAKANAINKEILNDGTMAAASGDNMYTGGATKTYIDNQLNGYVQSVTGTTNEIDVNNTDPQNPVASLPATAVFPGTARVGNILVSGNTISSENTDGNINLTPNGLGSLVLDGVNWPQADGTTGYFLQTNGAGQTSWQPATASVSGVWTPTLVGSVTAGTPTYVTQVGSYTKAGDMVTAWFEISVSDLGGMAGNFTIEGMPFAVDLTGRRGFGTVYNLSNMTDYYPMNLIAESGTVFGVYNAETYGSLAVPVSAGSATMLIAGVLFYQTA
jgi:hypothetical protein